MEETKRKKQIVNRLIADGFVLQGKGTNPKYFIADRTNFEELLIRFIYFGQ